MNMIVPNYGSVEKPAHVADDHVVDFDYLHPGDLAKTDVYAALAELQDAPEIAWTPRNGGHWIATRAETVRWVQENYEIFSHVEFNIPRGSSRIIMPPLTVDPPNHARFRAILNPAFAPRKVAELQDKARDLTVRLIEELKPSGRCEFIAQFARVMPVSVFLGIVDLPIEQREDFLNWGVGYLNATDQEQKDRCLALILDYLSVVLAERHAEPGDDLMSRIAAWRDNPRCAGEEEAKGMALLVFIGGLDTVANMLSFTVAHLARNPALRRRIADQPEIIPRAAEEFIRRFGLSNTGRLITRDVEHGGARMMAGEMIMVPIGISSIDERKYPDPYRIDFDREELFDGRTPAHDTFGNGPHKCIGAPLARAELIVFLEEWIKRIPDFDLDPERPPVMHMGRINGMSSLHLIWRGDAANG